MKIEKIYIDKLENGKEFIVFRFENGFEYDPDLRSTSQDWWLDHMRDKIWFTPEVEKQTLELLVRS